MFTIELYKYGQKLRHEKSLNVTILNYFNDLTFMKLLSTCQCVSS